MPYCKKCGNCGEDGCCSALNCAYECMVVKGGGSYCKDYFNDIEFMYRLAEALYDKYNDDEIFDTVYKEVYKE